MHWQAAKKKKRSHCSFIAFQCFPGLHQWNIEKQWNKKNDNKKSSVFDIITVYNGPRD